MTSRINIRQLRSHTDCAQRWKSAAIRLEECYKTKSGTYNNLVIKRSTFQLPPLKERLIQSFTDIRNTEGVRPGDVHTGRWAVVSSLNPGSSPAGPKPRCWDGSLPKARCDCRLTLLMQGQQSPTLGFMLDPALELLLHLILDHE